MGLPMTRYSLLTKLMREEKNQCHGLDELEEAAVRDVTGKRTLYAIVLCDHNDSKFRNYLTTHFSRLDRWTDENLLFFSLVKPDTQVEYKLKRFYDPEEALTSMNNYPVDDMLYQHALLEAFQVSVADLPALVLTTSLDSSDW